MSDYGLALVAMALVGSALWYILQPRYVFVIRIRRGQTTIVRGKMTGAMLGAFADLVQRHDLASGWIAGIQRGKRIALVFSYQIPADCRQQMRNVWTSG